MLDDVAIMVHNSEIAHKAALFMTFRLLPFPDSAPLRAHRVIIHAQAEATFEA